METPTSYLTGKDEEINLIIKTTDGKLKQYYADYKDYYYLPEEDTVIPKSPDPELTENTGLNNQKYLLHLVYLLRCLPSVLPCKQKQYLTYTLSCLIGTLERV